MSRRTKNSESPAPSFRDDLYGASPPPSGQRQGRRQAGTMAQDSPSPATSLASISSDKENHDSRAPVDKGKGREPMAPPQLTSSSRQKRQRPSEREPNLERSRRRRTVEVAEDDEENQDRSRRRQTVEVEEDEEPEYDPDQDIETRRELRKNLRNLGKELTENRTEYLAPKSTGLKDSLNRANELSVQVKQTSDATIDSRFLVQAADLSYKKTVALTSGDNAQGVDIEEFIAKLKQFMRQGNGGENATQRRRANNVEEDDEDIDGDMLDWEYLGRHACIKHTLRPSVPGFLLGPLSLEKRAKRVVVRRAALKHNNMRETRPEVLQAEDIEKDDEKMVTRLCGMITDTFDAYAETSRDAIEELYDEDAPILEQDKLLDKYGISRGDGGVALFKFVINPNSFGQTVENMFYISFLIRDGALGITFDERGLPYLVKKDKNAIRGGDAARHQAVLSLDMATWEDLIVAFDIKESIIPHRREDNHENAGQKGWYA